MIPKTRHTCGGPSFGRLIAGCPRCEELLFGAAPRKGWGWARREAEARQIEAICKHDCSKANCGPVCTFGDW